MNKLKTLILAVVFAAAAHAQTGTAQAQSTLLGYYADGQAAGSITAAYMRNFVASIVPATKTEGRLLRFGAANAVGVTTGLFEDGSGNVGIGTTGPAAKLDVNGNALIYDSTATTGATTLTVKAGAGQSTTDLLNVKSNADVSLFKVYGTGAVGLGVSVPLAKFHVEYSGANQFAGIFQHTAAAGSSDGLKVVAGGNATDTVLLVQDRTETSDFLSIKGDGNVSMAGTLKIAGTEATCEAATRGQMARVEGGAGVADTLRWCAKSAAGTYSWVAVDTAP